MKICIRIVFSHIIANARVDLSELAYLFYFHGERQVANGERRTANGAPLIAIAPSTKLRFVIRYKNKKECRILKKGP